MIIITIMIPLLSSLTTTPHTTTRAHTHAIITIPLANTSPTTSTIVSKPPKHNDHNTKYEEEEAKRTHLPPHSNSNPNNNPLKIDPILQLLSLCPIIQEYRLPSRREINKLYNIAAGLLLFNISGPIHLKILPPIHQTTPSLKTLQSLFTFPSL